MNLYIIVRHPEQDLSDENSYTNTWEQDWKLLSITTKPDLVDDCKMYDPEKWIYIYRTRLNSVAPQKIVCACKVEEIAGDKITFKDHQKLSIDPPFKANSGMIKNWNTKDLIQTLIEKPRFEPKAIRRPRKKVV